MRDSYYDRPEVSNSDLSWLKRELYGGEENPAAFRFGNLLDHAITEPDKVDWYARTCDGEEVTEEELSRAEEMKKAFFRDSAARKIHSLSEFQKVMANPSQLFDHEIPFRLPVRCKWDLWMPSLGWGGDIKSTSATTQRQFEEAADFFDYDRQRFFYMNIAGSSQDMLIGISKVNFKVFKVPVKRDSPFWKRGREKCLELAFKWWEMFGDLKQQK